MRGIFPSMRRRGNIRRRGARSRPDDPMTTRRRWLLALLVVPLLCVLGFALVAQRIVGAERARMLTVLADVPARRVAIVPGALVRHSGVPSPILVDRLAAALELYRAGKV